MTLPAARPRRRWVPGVLVGAGAVLVVGAVLADPSTTVASAPAPQKVAATPVLSARRAPDLLLAPVGRRKVAEAAAPVIAAAPPSSCLLVRDGDLDLVGSKPDDPLAPASNMKILVAAVALDVLGPATTFSTSVTGAGPGSDGTVEGNLSLVGGGDPLLTTETGKSIWNDGPQPFTRFEDLADQLVAKGVRRVTGGVVGDGSRHEGPTSLPGWPKRFVGNGIVGPLSALSVNDGWNVSPNPPPTGGGPVTDPPAHAAAVLTEQLRARGVVVDGPPSSGRAATDGTTLAEVESLPVDQLVGEMLAFSDNTTAEMLTREVGRKAADAPTTDAGTAASVSWLTSNGFDATGVVMKDGSGLTAENRLSCNLVADLLQQAGPDGAMADGLAVPARPGTLKDRLTAAKYRDAVRAKTGTLNSVTALSGWLRTVPGRNLVFAVLLNTSGRNVGANELSVQSRLLDSILAYPELPPREQVSPLPPVQR